MKKIEYYFELFENMIEGVGIYELIFDENKNPIDYLILYINKSYEDILDLNKDDVKGKLSSVVYGDVLALKEYSDVVINKKSSKFQFYYPKTKNHFNISVSPWGDIGFITIFSDITDIVLLEKNYYNIFENINVGIFQIKDGIFKTVNSAFGKILGYEVDELKNHKSINFYYNKEDRDELINNLERYGKVEKFITKGIRRNGQIIWVSIDIQQIKDFDGSVIYNEGTMIDITNYILIEETLKYNRERLEEAQKIAKIGNWEANLKTKELYWSNIIYDIFGLDYNFKLDVKLFHKFVHPDDMEKVLESEKLSEQTKLHDVIHRIIKHDGNIRYVHELAIRDGDILRGTVQDITDLKMSEELLNISENKYRRLFESSKDGILILDADTGKIIDVNPFLIDMLGYSKENFLEKSIWEIGFFKDIISNKENFLELQNKEYIRYEDMPLETYNGIKINVEFISNVYLVNDSKVIQCNIRDTTEHVKEKKFRILSNEILSILNSDNNLKDTIIGVMNLIKQKMNFSAVGIRLKNGDDFPYFVQSGFSDNFIFTENSIISKDKYGDLCKDKNGIVLLECTCGLVISGKINKLFTNGGSVWTNNGKFDSIYHPRNKCLHQGFISIAIIPIRGNDNIIGILQLNDVKKNVFTDKMIEFFEGVGEMIGVTIMRKKAENDLLIAKERAEKSDQMKMTFLSNMSHDLRTPINSIIGFSELLKENNISKEEKIENLDVIIKNGEILTNLVDDIIDISKIDSDILKIQKSEIDLNKFLSEINIQYLKEIKNSKVKLNIDIDLNNNVFLLADKYRLKQILMNLLNNSIKFTNKGYIKFGYKILNDNKLKIYVKDTGIGISKDDQSSIFSRFFQINQPGKKTKGTGLGLAISNSLNNLMDFGDILFESEFGKGSEFYLIAPFVSKNESFVNNKKQNDTIDIDLSDKKILIVDDNSDVQKILKGYLRSTKSIIFSDYGESVDSVLNIIKKNKIDIVLLDLGLENISGYDVLKEIKKYKNNIKIIIQSAYASTEFRDKAFKMGSDDFLSKPINKNKLLISIMKQIENTIN